MLHTHNSRSNTFIVAVQYDRTKTTIEITNLSKYSPSILVHDVHFEGKPSNLMTVNLFHYTVYSGMRGTANSLCH